MRRRHISVFSVLALLLTAGSARSEVYVFGDSLSDSGNFSLLSGGALPPTPPYAGGKFTNGPVWVEYLADYFNVPRPLPSLLGGANYSFNGSRASGISPFGTPDLALQVDLFIAEHGQSLSEEDVFLIWLGANDIFLGSAAGETAFINDALNAIGDAVTRIQQAGGQNFVLLNVPRLGQTPYFNSQPEIAAQLDFATDFFNSGLSALIDALQLSNEQACFVEVDIAALFEFAQRRPLIFRLENTTDACTFFDAAGTGLGFEVDPSANPNRYLFWDGIHPTTRGHEIAANTSLLTILAHLSQKFVQSSN